MEQQQGIIVLYSKYSPSSNAFLDILQKSPNDLNLTTLCIDNANVRKRILKSKLIQVTIVPCVLIVFGDGRVEKYDGPHAFKWVDTLIKKMAPPPPPPAAATPISPPPPRRPEGSKRTAVEDLVSDEEEEMTSRPPVPIRTDSGNYDPNGQFGEVDDTERVVTKGIKQTLENIQSGGGTGKGNLMAQAMAMRKSRERDDSEAKQHK